ncbi:MerR family transcriptional regulator [Bacillus cereus]|uniref:MerR family transcriptional regulator n=1 Tax=Bacillus cereus TaxID=1396 RepID=UPI0014829352|nr:MerR family transcriptional regulator [Bacillus cereus]
MNIKEVSVKTGLTKKAIRYYEEIGLIKVNKDSHNQYRIYGINDVEKLKTIAFLRDLDFTLNQIKNILNHNVDFMEELKKVEEQIHIDSINIEQKKNKIEIIKENWNSGRTFEDVAGFIKPSNIYMDQLSTILQKIFPGPFGKFIEISMSPFLDIKIETAKDIKTFEKLINLLDNIPSVPNNHPLIQQILNKDLNEIEKFKEDTQLFYDGIIHKNMVIINDYKEKMKIQINSIKNDEKLRKVISQQHQMSKGLPNLTIDSEFSELLKDLNPNYKNMVINFKQIQSELNDELGFNYQDYLLSL